MEKCVKEALKFHRRTNRKQDSIKGNFLKSKARDFLKEKRLNFLIVVVQDMFLLVVLVLTTKKLHIVDPLILTFATDLSYRKFLTDLFCHKVNCPLFIYKYLSTIIATTNIRWQKFIAMDLNHCKYSVIIVDNDTTYNLFQK